MAFERSPQESSPAPSAESQPAWTPAARRNRLWRIASALLVAGAALQVITLLLPWDHLAIPSERVAFDFPISTFINDVPFQELLYANQCVPDARVCPHLTLAAIFWDIFWRGALLFIDFLLTLAVLAARRVMIRWLFAVLFGLWLLYTTGLVVSFVATAYTIDTVGDNAPNQPAWWPPYFQVGVERAGTTGNPVTFAWGFWLYLAALAICWLALGLTITSMLRRRREGAAGSAREASAHGRNAPLPAILLTSGALIWTISLAAAPLVVMDCSRPLTTVTPTDARLTCPYVARVYSLQVSMLDFLYLDVVPAQPIALAEQEEPGPVLLGALKYFCDFALLVLAVVATPLALVVVWRRPWARGTAAWLSAWIALGLMETGILLWGVSMLLAPNPPPFVRPAFALGVGPGAVLVPLGVVVMAAGVVAYWLQLRRDGLRRAPATDNP